MSRNFSIIAAADLHNGIGHANNLPWKIPSEMAWFKQQTTLNLTNAVIMGRNTWNSLHKPLSNRVNIVLSSSLHFLEGCIVCKSLDEALAHCEKEEIAKIWVIGGAKLYEEAINSPFCQAILLSRILSIYPSDVHFPNIPERFYKVEQDLKSENMSWKIEAYLKSQ